MPFFLKFPDKTSLRLILVICCVASMDNKGIVPSVDFNSIMGDNDELFLLVLELVFLLLLLL